MSSLHNLYQKVRHTEYHLLEPVGDGHHDVEGSQEEDKMEVSVAVDRSLFLIIHHVLA